MPTLPTFGEPAPFFRGPTLNGNEQFGFDTVAGRYVVLLFAGSAGLPAVAEAMEVVGRHRQLFDDHRACFFGVTSNPEDAAAGRIAKQIPGIRWFLDYDRSIARLYGVADKATAYRPCWILLDRALNVVATASISRGEGLLRRLTQLVAGPKAEGFAPVLIVPRVFDRAMCRRLIDLYDGQGGSPSGFMRDVDGVTVGIHDHNFKRRSDYYLDNEPDLRKEIRATLLRILIPQIERAFQFRATRLERYMVACYDGDGGGYFRPHRDNTTTGTAHRRFACSINLNAEEYEGGDLRFPEFGSRLYRPPTGGAVVFSCSLLHEATAVTRGRRYAYLPFFYDEAAAKLREANAATDKVAPHLANYRA